MNINKHTNSSGLKLAMKKFELEANFPHSTVIFRKYFKNIEMLQYCKNDYKAVRKVSEILQKPCNGHSKHYKWNVAAIFIFHCNIVVM